MTLLTFWFWLINLGVSEPEKDKISNENENGKTPCPFPNIINDGVCDASTNNLICDFDGGDCCDSSTQGSAYLLFCEGCECLNSTTEVFKINGIVFPKLFGPSVSKIVLVFEILFVITRAIYSNRERSEQLLKQNASSNYSWNTLEKLWFKLEKMGFRNMQQKLKIINRSM